MVEKMVKTENYETILKLNEDFDSIQDYVTKKSLETQKLNKYDEEPLYEEKVSNKFISYEKRQNLEDYEGKKKPKTLHRKILKIPFSTENNGKNQWECTECNKYFSKMEHLQIHVASIHEGKKIFKKERYNDNPKKFNASNPISCMGQR